MSNFFCGIFSSYCFLGFFCEILLGNCGEKLIPGNYLIPYGKRIWWDDLCWINFAILRYIFFWKISFVQKMKFSIKNFFGKCDLIRNFLWIWSHLLKKSLTEIFIFCGVFKLMRILHFRISCVSKKFFAGYREFFMPELLMVMIFLLFSNSWI